MITINPFIVKAATKAIYTDNFDSLTINYTLAGLGSWIYGLNELKVWQASAGNNVISPYSSTAYSAAIYNAALAADQYAQIKMIGVTTAGRIGVGVRMSGATSTFNGYGFIISGSPGYCAIIKFTNGVGATLGTTGTVAAVANDIFKITAVGSTITVYKNGSVFTSVGTAGVVTDSAYTTGKGGVVGYGSYNDATADLFETGEL